jgi:hypothetical protein
MNRVVDTVPERERIFKKPFEQAGDSFLLRDTVFSVE